MSDYEVRVVERSGRPVAVLDRARVEKVRKVLNEPGVAEISVPLDDPKLARVAVLDHTQPGEQAPEVQVWRNGRIYHWGVFLAHNASTSDGRVTFRCPGLLWYFRRRVVGRSSGLNLLSNASFEDGIDLGGGGGGFGNWVVTNTTPDRITSHRFHGRYGLQLENSGAGQAAYVAQYSPELPAGPYTLRAKVHLRSDAPWSFAGAVNSYGMTARRYSSTFDYIGQKARLLAPKYGHRAGRSYTLVIKLNNPEDGHRYLVRLYSPRGRAVWDEVSLRGAHYLAGTTPADMATIIRILVQHAQDPAAGKQDLNIGTDCPATGENETRRYWEHEALNIWSAIDDFLDDLDVSIDDATRTFRTHYPQRGQYRPELALVGGKNVTEAEQEGSGEETLSRVIMRNKERAWHGSLGDATDTTYTGGLILEDVVDTKPGVRGKALDRAAESRLRKTRRPTKVPTLVCASPVNWSPEAGVADPADLIDNLEIGDTVPIDIEGGPWLTEQHVMRVVATELEPPAGDVLKVTVNP